MGINPGNPAFGLPPAEDSLVRQLKDLERTTRENLASVVRSFKGTVAELRATQEELATAQAGLATAQSNLADTQADLTAAQTELSTTVGRLDDTIVIQNQTIAALVTPLWASNTITGFAVPAPATGGITVSASMVVPAGMTKCSLIIIADAFAHGADGETSTLQLSITEPINSIAYDIVNVPDSAFASIPTFAVGGINDLTPGDIMTFSALLRTGTTAGLAANFNNHLTIAASATFRR